MTDVDGLTGLAEYRNGGLFLDTGVINLREGTRRRKQHAVDSALVVEWRALTVALLDLIAPLVPNRPASGPTRSRSAGPRRRHLGDGPPPRTETAGRRPPFAFMSDGTVF